GRVLAAVAAGPDLALAAVPVMDAAERQALVSAGSATARGLAAVTVPELVAAPVTRAPDTVAVADGEMVLTYGGLDAESSRVASVLAGRGVARGDVVAVKAARSANLVAVLLGVLKAGAAYLPVDPSYPAERVEFMLADADPAAVLDGGRIAGDGDAVLPDLVPADAAYV